MVLFASRSCDWTMLRIELNSATDNRCYFKSEQLCPHEVVSQGNFHGEIVALTCDAMSLALFELGISERRMDQMLDPARSQLPAFSKGFRINRDDRPICCRFFTRRTSRPCCSSLSTTSMSVGQEDHVSMVPPQHSTFDRFIGLKFSP